MDESVRKLIKASGLKMDTYSTNPAGPCMAHYKFGEEPWVKSEFYSQHKLLNWLWEAGMIEQKAKEAEDA